MGAAASVPPVKGPQVKSDPSKMNKLKKKNKPNREEAQVEGGPTEKLAVVVAVKTEAEQMYLYGDAPKKKNTAAKREEATVEGGIGGPTEEVAVVVKTEADEQTFLYGHAPIVHSSMTDKVYRQNLSPTKMDAPIVRSSSMMDICSGWEKVSEVCGGLKMQVDASKENMLKEITILGEDGKQFLEELDESTCIWLEWVMKDEPVILRLMKQILIEKIQQLVFYRTADFKYYIWNSRVSYTS
jgi:hypothetical protein